MSEKELQKFSKALQKAENAARIRLFDKASSQYNNLIDTAKSLQPDLANGFQFLTELYSVNHDVSKQKDPIETGSMRRLNSLSTSIPNIVLTVALPGGVFGDYETDRIFSETRGILMMDQGIRDKDTKVLKHAIEHFLKIGKAPLFFSRYVNVIGRRVSGNRAALECEAKSELIVASSLEDANPSAAIPHYMLATRALRAARRDEDENKYRQILIGLKKVRPCWFCGRTVQGENHFRRMATDATPYFENLLIENKEDLRVLDSQEIYACTPCASAITKEADRIALHYRDALLKRIEVLSQQINQLQEVLVTKGDLVREP
ncbi:MAG: hypothetical protein ACFFCX_16910 [Candidatus Sifarchaeia archaeon]